MRIVLGVEPDLGVPRRLRDIQRHIGTRRLERRERKHEPRFLAQFPRRRSGRILGPGCRAPDGGVHAQSPAKSGPK